MSEPNKAVFLSYASQDAEAAQFMPIISANTQARHEGYFRLEWRLADQRTHLMGKSRAFLVPVSVDETRDADADVPDSFAAMQWSRLPKGQTPTAFVERVSVLLNTDLLKGDFFAARSHPGDLEQANEKFRQALQLDPNYALAWARLARVYFRQAGTPGLSQAEGQLKIRDALQHALSIDPNLAAAHHWMGRVFMNFDWNWSAAKSEYEHAIAMDPNGIEGGLARKDLLAMEALLTGRFDDWARGEVKALADNPLDVQELWFAGWMLCNGGHLQEALNSQRRLLELDPAFRGVHGATAQTLLLMGRNAEALAEAQKETNEESRLQQLSLAYWAVGRQSDSDKALSQLEANFAQEDSYDIAEVHAYRREAEAANTWLERAYATRFGAMLLMKTDPLLRNLHNDPRYQVLLGKMRMPDTL